MNTFRHAGKRIPYTNSGSAISSGDVVVLASGATGFIGIAVTGIDATTGKGELEVTGVHELTKKSGDAFTAGGLVYWDASNKQLTSTSSGNTRAGRAAAAAASDATSADVILNAA